KKEKKNTIGLDTTVVADVRTSQAIYLDIINHRLLEHSPPKALKKNEEKTRQKHKYKSRR
ncbi:hypothetical protein L873DRAFT_1818898, partial [Choiromyces venosus 120613-1]